MTCARHKPLCHDWHASSKLLVNLGYVQALMSISILICGVCVQQTTLQPTMSSTTAPRPSPSRWRGLTAMERPCSTLQASASSSRYTRRQAPRAMHACQAVQLLPIRQGCCGRRSFTHGSRALHVSHADEPHADVSLWSSSAGLVGDPAG